MVLQNILTISVNLVDNMMLGGYSETALSGVAVVNQIQFVYQQILVALGEGVVIFCSQYWGKRQTGPVEKISAVVLWTVLGIALFLFITVTVFPGQTLRIFTSDEAIIEQGSRYLAVIRFTFFFFAVTQMLLAMLRSMEIVRIEFVLSVLVLCLNSGINWILIYGRFGAPELGVEGDAIGTLAARIVECSVLILYIAKTFLMILSVVMVGMSYQMPTNNGIIRGGGSAIFVVKVDLISIWMIVLPLSFVMAFVVNASPVVVLCCLNADQIFKCIPAYVKVNYGNWIRKLTREETKPERMRG